MKTASIFRDLQFDDHKPAVTLMMETDFTKEIRIVFQKGQCMDEHTAPFPITVEVAKGAIDFGVNGEVHLLGSGDIISLSGNVPHDLKAVNDSVVRLTLSKGDKAERVKRAV